jgi:hypothetical protein
MKPSASINLKKNSVDNNLHVDSSKKEANFGQV